ncbi:GntR family transcriptional regulator [Rhizobium sp. Root482]|uniref:GntR family transcriptional regulator n=1 Tax=Rhizobium sp. Root482 TaxID=1736543 RepID=UPI00070150DD|nr:GntR family transcriptional regulator [Rhizobium sp. Root482]KQY18564.1 GntR family transcriptional regulator [Rhizobium sp. Root482]
MSETPVADGRHRQAPSLGDAAYSELKERLSRGVYRPGDKLTVRSVAETLGVSSTPARDAINRLAADSAVVYAGPKTVLIPVLGEADLREVTLIRIALEGLAAQHSVQSCTQQHIDKLWVIQRNINAALENGDYGQALWQNKEFHFLVYRLSRLPHLVSMIESQWLRVGPSFYGLYPEFAEAKYGVRNHEMVIEALIDQDGGALRAAFENDIRDGYRRLRQALRERATTG